MKKREAVNLSMEAYEKAGIKQEWIDEKEHLQKIKPNLLKRFGCILLDFLMIAIVTLGLVAAASFTVAGPLGYNESVQLMDTMRTESHLYVVDGSGKYTYISDEGNYDVFKTPEQNYDEPITYYYSNIDYCIADNRLEQYNSRKIESGYYEVNAESVIVRKAEVTTETAKKFLQTEYATAVNYLRGQQKYIKANNQSLTAVIVIVAVSLLISTSIFYFLVPMITKEGETIGMLACKICVVNLKDYGHAARWQITLRFVFTYVLVFLIPVLFYSIMPAFCSIPPFFNALLICFTKTNSGINEFASQTMVISKTRTDEFEIIRQLKQKTEIKHERKGPFIQ